MEKYSVIDLFAGAGGLSLGFEQTNKYSIKVAFENNPNMQKTYKHNHPNVDVRGDVCSADYSEIQEKYGKIDVVIGGPPCQGFSNANRQKNHAISQNNMLVKQYLRAVISLQPKAFVMENVSMLKSDVHRFYMEKGDEELVKHYDIPTNTTPIHLLDQKYVFNGVLDIIKDVVAIKAQLWDEIDYNELNIIYKTTKNIEKLKTALQKHKVKLEKAVEKQMSFPAEDENAIRIKSREAFSAISDYYSGQMNAEDLKNKIEPAIMLQRMLSKSLEILEQHLIVDEYSSKDGIDAIVSSYAVYDYLKNILASNENGYTIKSDVLCAAKYGAPQKRMRFVLMGIKKDIAPIVAFPNGSLDEDEYHTVKEAIGDLEDFDPVFDIDQDVGIPMPKIEVKGLVQKLRDSSTLYNHITTKTTDTAMERFRAIKQGENFHSLDKSLKTNTYTDASRTQNTIYLRLAYDAPCGTVVNVRKSMWIHPTKDRAISVREAARLQTFPDSFIFCGSKDQQYQQVGNAVPPIMAKSVAKKLAKLLSNESKSKPPTD
ncbi:DNA cytosine methyltransferase [Hydrogenoanaerobacterium sp.]|uniref:DNA cytosine methyltransferase n=1 Tax=Hydrogenoanaerobacterium sp. TaxID=2953763 RepID=UPI0028A2D787|nr:DNA cytosine methyltransferase [Hydrogenoanaerobacterium sp.]